MEYRIWRTMLFTTRNAGFLFLLLLLVASNGCGGGEDTGAFDTLTQVRALQANRQLWRSKAVSDYRLVIDVDGGPFIRYQTNSTVRGGSITSFVAANLYPNEPEFDEAQQMSLQARFGNVEVFFDDAERMLRSEVGSRIRVTYDPMYGYPVEVSSNSPGGTVQDGSSTRRVTEFQPL